MFMAIDTNTVVAEEWVPCAKFVEFRETMEWAWAFECDAYSFGDEHYRLESCCLDLY